MGELRDIEVWGDLTPKQTANARAWLEPFLVEGERIEVMFECDAWRPLMSIAVLTNARLVGVPDEHEGRPRRQVARAEIVAVRSERRRVRRRLVVEHGDGVLRFAGVSERIALRLALRLAREPVGREAPRIEPEELHTRPDEVTPLFALEGVESIAFVALLLCVLWVSPAPLAVQISLTVIGVLGVVAFAGSIWEALRWHFGQARGASDAEFDALIDEVESAGKLDPREPDDFDLLVRQALDALPHALHEVLRGNVAVIVSDLGADHGAHGLYDGDRIVLFRDTLVEQFGDNPDRLREQVKITVLHELAHHLGADERRVRELGLE